MGIMTIGLTIVKSRVSWTVITAWTTSGAYHRHRNQSEAKQSGFKKTLPFRFPLLKIVVLDWFMVISYPFLWSI